jgi:hypothetical protein
MPYSNAPKIPSECLVTEQRSIEHGVREELVFDYIVDGMIKAPVYRPGKWCKYVFDVLKPLAIKKLKERDGLRHVPIDDAALFPEVE